MLRYMIIIEMFSGLGFASTARAEERDEDQRVIAQLDRKLPKINFTGQELVDVVDFMRDVSGANIYVNWKELEAAGITKNAKVDLQLNNVKFRDAMKSMLEKVGTEKGKATFEVRDGLIYIATAPDPKHPRPPVTMTGFPKDLDRSVPEINFNGQALSDVMDFLRDVGGLKIEVDWNALEKAGISKDAPVAARVRDVKMSTVIRYIMEDAGAGKAPIECVFADKMLKITAKPIEKKKEDK
jgi:hypothetical protein